MSGASRRGSLGLAGALCIAGIALLTACSPGLTNITVEELTTPPATANVGNARLRLTEGTGVGLKILAFTEDPTSRDSNGNRPNAIDPSHVKITSDNESVAKVMHVDAATYIVTATAPGNTKLIVNSTDTSGFVELPVEVVAQP